MSNTKITSLVTLSFIMMTMISGLIMSSSLVSADDYVVDEISISVPTACSLTGTGMNSHNATIPNGTSNSNIGTSTITAFCNDADGFAIYAIGYTDDTFGKNVLTNPTLGSNYDIATGTLTSGANSQWAMKLAAVSSPTPTYPITIQNSFNTFQSVPSDNTLVAKRDSATDSGQNAEGSSFTTTYQAYISPTQASGTYVGQVRYTLLHPGSNAPNTIRIAQEVDEWANTLLAGQEITMMDIRDGKTYTAAKLADGNLWMTQNLALEIDSTKTYTSADTDLPSGTTWTPLRSTYTLETVNWCQDGRSARGECNESYTPESLNIGNRFWNGIVSDDCSYDYFESGSYARGCIEETLPYTGNQHHSVGIYYNQAAASAVNDISIYDGENNILNSSICPAGWKLPDVNDFVSLINALYDSPTPNNYFSSSAYFIPTGVVDGESGWLYLGNIGKYGYYYIQANWYYNRFFNISQAGFSNSLTSSGEGVSVRCFKDLSN